MSSLDILFQRNTIFTIVCLVLSYGFISILPSKMPRSVSILVMLFSLDMAKGLDTSIGVEPFDFYNANIYSFFDIADLLTWCLYPVSGYLFIYYYHKFRIHGILIPFYILLCSLIGTAFEALNVYFDVFQYHQWRLRYSFCIYLVVQTLSVILFTRLKMTWTEQQNRSIRRINRN
jgi:hypothetical protein